MHSYYTVIDYYFLNFDKFIIDHFIVEQNSYIFLLLNVHLIIA